MIRVLALYSQCKQQLDMFTALATNYATARYLAYVLKTLLGLESIAKLAFVIYIPVVEDGMPIANLHKAKCDKSAQSTLLVLARKVLLYAEQRILHQY